MGVVIQIIWPWKHEFEENVWSGWRLWI